MSAERMRRTAIGFGLLAMMLAIGARSVPSEEYETVRTSNAAILNRLGLVPLGQPDGHHRKRLAGPEAFGTREAARLHPAAYGRRQQSGSPRDSHVYVVKLPASPPYYSFSKPEKHADKDVTVAKPNPGFRNNGKPAKIYHWNLPLVNKINEKKKHLALAKIEQTRKKLEAEKERLKVAEKLSYFKKFAQDQLVGQAQRKPSRNNDKWLNHPEHAERRFGSAVNATQLKVLAASTLGTAAEKIHRLGNEADRLAVSRNVAGQHRFNNWHEASGNEVHGSRNGLEGPRTKSHKKKSAVSYYYAPALAGKSISTSISKHFAGNGKPKAFYVMEKSRKPVYYHPLLP